MAEASRTVLKVMKLKTDAELISYPDRFIDQERGGVFFDSVMEILQEIQKVKVYPNNTTSLSIWINRSYLLSININI